MAQVPHHYSDWIRNIMESPEWMQHPPWQRDLMEANMLLSDSDFEWSDGDSEDSSDDSFDFRNPIVTQRND